MEDRLIKFIEDSRESMKSDLSEFIAIPSVSTNLEEVKNALDFILEKAKSKGFAVDSVLNNQVGIIEIGQGEEVVGILAHVDVVDAGDLDKWETPPFEMVPKNGKLFGRGTIDDKGAVVASLYAMEAVKNLGIPFKKKIQLILGTQEEVEWVDIEEYVEKFKLPDFGFTPDGEYPVCSIEKGLIGVTLEFPMERKKEQEKNEIISISAGTSQNVVPGNCKLEMSNGEPFVFSGKTTHACQPEKGENAIIKCGREISLMNLHNNNRKRVLEWIIKYFEDAEGSELGLRSESEYKNGDFVHRNIFTPTKIWEEGDSLFVYIDIRTRPELKEAEARQVLDSKAKEIGGRVSDIMFKPAVYVSSKRPFISLLAEAYEEASGLKNECTLAYGGSYAKAMPNIVSWGPIFPGEEDTCHEENEFIYEDSLLMNGKIFALALGKMVFCDEMLK